MGTDNEQQQPWRSIQMQDITDLSLKAEGAGASVYQGFLQSTSATTSNIIKEHHQQQQQRYLQDDDNDDDDDDDDNEFHVQDNKRISIALRKPRITSTVALLRFEAELELRSKLQHPNILPLLGACSKAPNYFTISPWMEGGTLFDIIHTKNINMSFERILKITLQLAKSIQHIHSLNLVHRDIKTSNILLDKKWEHCMLSDLDLLIDINHLEKNKGRALHRGPSNGRLSHMVGTLVYMAPEILSGHPHHFSADAYAFAITINEMCATAVPFVDRKLPIPELHTVLETRFNEVKLRGAIVRDQLRPVLANGIALEFKQLIQNCWSHNPDDRPNFNQIVNQLEQLLNKGSAYLSQFYGSTMPSVDNENQNSTNYSNDSNSNNENDNSNNKIINSDTNGNVLAKQSSVEKAEILLHEFDQAMENPKLPIWQNQNNVNNVSSQVKTLDIRGALSSTSGERGEDCMEDRSIVIPNAGGLNDTYIYGIFDGHGGQECAEFAKHYLPGAIYRIWDKEEATPESALIHAFEDTDYAFLNIKTKDQSGCTALALMICQNQLFVANAGDCRCILSKMDGNVVELSKDHIAIDEMEKLRIQARGGFVSVSGRVQGCLMVSRAFGDRSVKRFISATPEVLTKPIEDDDDFLILASDGLWDVVRNQSAVDLVRSTVRIPEMAAKRLALKAIELGSDDNISVIVVFLRGVVSYSSV